MNSNKSGIKVAQIVTLSAVQGSKELKQGRKEQEQGSKYARKTDACILVYCTLFLSFSNLPNFLRFLYEVGTVFFL